MPTYNCQMPKALHITCIKARKSSYSLKLRFLVKRIIKFFTATYKWKDKQKVAEK